MTRAICVGECMVELRPQDGLLAQGFAGDAYNTAVYLKRSAPQLQVQFATVLGRDPFSLAMRQAWRAEGVQDDLAFSAPGKQPGLYLIETDPDGERRFHYWRSESAARGWFRVLAAHGGAEALAGADLLYISGISLAILTPGDRPAALDLLRSLRGRVGRIAFDPNFRPALWPSLRTAREVADEAVGIADIMLPSQEDLERLYGVCDPEAQMALLEERGAQEVAITSDPGRCLVREGTIRWVDGPRASEVLDTSGAGDSFNGAYLAARLQGRSADEAAKAGLGLAAKVVGGRGAIIASTPELS
jgi:2-dehydro-3-deoxygluconokinase